MNGIPSPGLSEPTGPVSTSRQQTVHGLIGILCGLIFLTNLTGKELWPVCNYPMFATLEHPGDKNETEIEMVQQGRIIPMRVAAGDFFETQLSFGLTRLIHHAEDWQSPGTRAFLHLVLARLIVEARDDGKISGGPAILRVYQTHDHYSTAGGLQRHSDDRTLLVEVTDAAP